MLSDRDAMSHGTAKAAKGPTFPTHCRVFWPEHLFSQLGAHGQACQDVLLLGWVAFGELQPGSEQPNLLTIVLGALSSLDRSSCNAIVDKLLHQQPLHGLQQLGSSRPTVVGICQAKQLQRSSWQAAAPLDVWLVLQPLNTPASTTAVPQVQSLEVAGTCLVNLTYQMVQHKLPHPGGGCYSMSLHLASLLLPEQSGALPQPLSPSDSNKSTTNHNAGQAGTSSAASTASKPSQPHYAVLQPTGVEVPIAAPNSDQHCTQSTPPLPALDLSLHQLNHAYWLQRWASLSNPQAESSTAYHRITLMDGQGRIWGVLYRLLCSQAQSERLRQPWCWSAALQHVQCRAAVLIGRSVIFFLTAGQGVEGTCSL